MLKPKTAPVEDEKEDPLEFFAKHTSQIEVSMLLSNKRAGVGAGQLWGSYLW